MYNMRILLEACPVGNEPMVDILRMRQDLVLMESKFPREAMEVFDKIENYGNPWGTVSYTHLTLPTKA